MIYAKNDVIYAQKNGATILTLTFRMYQMTIVGANITNTALMHAFVVKTLIHVQHVTLTFADVVSTALIKRTPMYRVPTHLLNAPTCHERFREAKVRDSGNC